MIDGNTDKLIGKWWMSRPSGHVFSMDINPLTNMIYISSRQSPLATGFGVRGGISIIDADSEPFYWGLSFVENLIVIASVVVAAIAAIVVGSIVYFIRRSIRR